jgi:hypothetical protein
MPNVKPGDLAIVVGAYYCTENIGRIVEVVRQATPGVDVVPSNAGLSWMVKSSRPLGRVAAGYTKRLAPGFEAPCADVNLRPVSGIPETDEVKDTLHA